MYYCKVEVISYASLLYCLLASFYLVLVRVNIGGHCPILNRSSSNCSADSISVNK